jgi:hypothetical protein
MKPMVEWPGTRADLPLPECAVGAAVQTMARHENDFIMATKIDQIFDRSTKSPSR